MDRNTPEDLKGRVKVAVGDLTDDKELQREGKMDRISSAVKHGVDDADKGVKEAVGAAVDKVDEIVHPKKK